MIGLILGTGEGKNILRLLNRYTDNLVISTATEYGGELLKNFKFKHMNTSPKDKEGLKALCMDYGIKVLVDASHPYAKEVSKNALECTKELNIPYLRYERPSVMDEFNSDLIITIESYDELKTVIEDENSVILNTTGSRGVKTLLELNLPNRIVHRVLPQVKVLEELFSLGVKVEDIVAIKGPIGYELNKGFIEEYHADYVLLKDSGLQGGTNEKLMAAIDLGVKSIVVKRKNIDYGKVFDSEEKLASYIHLNYKELF